MATNPTPAGPSSNPTGSVGVVGGSDYDTPGTNTASVANATGSNVGQFQIKGVTANQDLQNPNAANYAPVNANQINSQIASGANIAQSLQGQSQASQAQLAPTATYGASAIAPLMMLGSANTAPTTTYSGANINTAPSNQTFAAQNQAINNLNNIATGNGPNAATISAAQQAQANSAAQMAAIASAGGNPALAQRNASNAVAQQNQQNAANAVLGSANEQLGAQSTLQSALGNVQSQQQAIATGQAGLQQQAALQNASSANQASQQSAALTNQNLLANQSTQSQGALTQAGMNQAAAAANAGATNTANLQQGTMDQQTNLQNANNMLQAGTINVQQYNAMLNANMQQSSFQTAQNENYSNALLQNQDNLAALASGSGIAQMNQTDQIVGSAAGGIAAAGGALATAASDKRAKKSIKKVDRSLNAFLTALNKPMKVQNASQ